MEKKNVKVRIIKFAPPPPELPVYGKINSKEVSFIGKTNYVTSLEEKRYIFGIKRADRRRHLYIIGKSGVGKSKLLELLVRQDIYYGYGVCVIDPYGDLIDVILDFIPKNRVNDVCIIDPSDTNYPISFNPLQNVDPTFKYQLTQGLIEILEKQFGANWTSRLEHVFRFTCLALLDYPKATMQGMISLLVDREYRQKVIEHIQDDMVKRFWAVEFADWSEKFNAEAIIPLVNKLNQFLLNPMLRNIFGQKENKVDLGDLMNNNKIILINLAKGKIGEENSSFFGSMFIIKIKQAGMARAKLPEKERNDFYLYVDEFYNVVTQTFENILAEARKYRICLTVAHQYLSQLIPSIQKAVLGNVGGIIIFRIGGEDAIALKPEMAPVFDVKDMINLGIKEFYIKMTIDGENYDPFSAETLNVLNPPHPSFRDEIIKISRGKYALDLREILLEEKFESQLLENKDKEKEAKKEEVISQFESEDLQPLI